MKKVSAIILSGGLSKRMGEDKCELLFNGNTLINNQIIKMKNVGIEDIILSGYRKENDLAKVVHDDIMKGPLSGLYYGLKEIKNDRAVVLSVDVPLIKEESIKKLIDFSFDNDLDVACLGHGDKSEQLIGIFKKSLIDKIKNILDGDKYSVMKLLDNAKVDTLYVDDDDLYFLNVNNKNDYNKLLEMNFIGGVL